MKARCRDENNSNLDLLHTLNGSALAIGRTLIAIMENYQTEKGEIVIPDVLQQYMGDKNYSKPFSTASKLSLASPKYIRVFSLKNRGFWTPA